MPVEPPSFAARRGYVFNFVNVYMYEWDALKVERALRRLQGELLDICWTALTGAFRRSRARGGQPGEPRRAEHAARSADELAVFLAELAPDHSRGAGACAMGGLARPVSKTASSLTAPPPGRGTLGAELADEYRAVPEMKPGTPQERRRHGR